MIDKISMMNRARLKKRQSRDEAVKNQAIEFFKKHKDNSLFLSGVVLYWAEGTRLSKNYRKYQLALTNSDSNLISFYCDFLRKYFRDIDNKDWRGELFLYPDINPEQAQSFWSQIMNIPAGQFIKTQILNSKIKHGRRLKFGTCCLYINSKDACLTMQTWIEAIAGMRR